MPARDLRDTETQPLQEGAPEDVPVQPRVPGALLALDATHQQTAVRLVLSDYDAALKAREAQTWGLTAKGDQRTFDSWMKELVDLYFGYREAKVVPWKFCSNRSLMIAMAIVETLHARLLPAVYSEELTHWRPGEVNDAARAERVGKLMTWWIRVRSRLAEFFDRWVRTVLVYGSVTSETLWDVQYFDRGEMSEPQTLLLPDGGVQVSPPEKVLHPLERTRSDIILPEDVFLQEGASDIQRDPVTIRVRYLFRDLEEMEREGEAENITIRTDPTQPTLMELLPVDASVGAAGLSPEETAELKRVALRNVVVECLRWYGGIDLDGDGFPEQLRLLIARKESVYLGGVPLHTLSKRGLRPLDHTQYVARVNEPQGLRGMGVLEQVRELAYEIDAIFNQLTDANSLSVLRPIFYDPGGDIQPEALKLAPNRMTPVARPNESVFIPDMTIQTDRLLNAIRLVLEFIERLTAASAYIFGKESEIVGGSGTATRTQAIVGSAEQRFSVPVQRLRNGAARLMTIHLDILQRRLPPELEKRILGEDGAPLFGMGELTDEGLAGEFDAYQLPDESLGSKEMERQLAQQLYALLLQNVLVASDPAKIYKLTADLLRSWGKDPESYLGPAPDMAIARSPADEHTLILQGDFSQVRATVAQNPIEHLLAHQAFSQEIQQHPTLNDALKQQILQFLQGHMQEHVQMMQLALTASRGGGGGGANPAGGPSNGQPGQRESEPESNGPGAAPPPTRNEPRVGAATAPLAAAHRTQQRGEGSRP